MSKILEDYPTIAPQGNPNFGHLAGERGGMLKLALKELPAFVKWFEKSMFFGRMSADLAASYYADVNYNGPHSQRWSFQQVLGQLYEQRVLGQVRSYPRTLSRDSESKVFIFRKKES